jgi:pyruvate/2-oxoglutarate dehydrogenase complex dihydrolipoamide dehydrogenase (E3) component
MAEKFDAIIIGAGQAGPSLAGRLTDTGQTVAVIERKLVGGTCVNTGCIPTKTLVASAHAAHLARRGTEYGVGTGEITVEMAKVKARYVAECVPSAAYVTGNSIAAPVNS